MAGVNAAPSQSGCQDCDVDALIEGGKRAASFEYFHYSTPFVTLTSGQNVVQNIPFFSDSYFIVKKLSAATVGSFSTRIINTATGRVLMDTKVNNNNLFGTILLPNVMRDPLVIPPSGQLQLDLTDLSLAANVIQPVFIGYRWFNLAMPPTFGKKGYFLQWYQYSASVTLAANGLNQITTTIDADADFLVRKLVSTQSGPYSLQLTDSSSKDNWFNQDQANGNVAGSVSYPNILAKPKLMKANSAITANFRDLSGATNTIQLIYEGAKIYRG